MQCWKCGLPNSDAMANCARCGADIRVALPPAEEGDSTGGLIPYKNPKALIAYYLGILSGLPFIGLPIGIAAFILGFMGLRDRKKNPVIKGSVHAGIGIGCGLVFTLLWGALLVGLVIAWLSEHH
jgi:hypothetical protein